MRTTKQLEELERQKAAVRLRIRARREQCMDAADALAREIQFAAREQLSSEGGAAGLARSIGLPAGVMAAFKLAGHFGGPAKLLSYVPTAVKMWNSMRGDRRR